MKLVFWPSNVYCKEFDISISNVRETIIKRFIPQLERLIFRELQNRLRKATKLDQDDIIISSKKQNDVEDGGETDEKEESKAKSKKKEAGKKSIESNFRNASDSEKDDSEDENGENNAEKEKLKKVRSQQATYEEESDDDVDEKVDDIDDDEIGVASATDDDVINESTYVSSFKFDDQNSNSCEFNMEVLISSLIKILIVSCEY